LARRESKGLAVPLQTRPDGRSEQRTVKVKAQFVKPGKEDAKTELA
jgi:hypothetical protein